MSNLQDKYPFAIGVSFTHIVTKKVQAKSLPDVARFSQERDLQHSRHFSIRLMDFTEIPEKTIRDASEGHNFILYGTPYMYYSQKLRFLNLRVQDIESSSTPNHINKVVINSVAETNVYVPSRVLYHNQINNRNRCLQVKLYGGNANILIPDGMEVPNISEGEKVSIEGVIDTYGGSMEGRDKVYYNHIVANAIEVEKGLF